MKLILQSALAGLLCLFSVSVFAQTHGAEEITQISRSVGKRADDSSIDLRAALKQQAAVKGQLRQDSPIEARDALARLANRHDQHFNIYDASVELLADIDGDGFHHLMNVIFDVDVDYDSATLYAKLYLSREGGPWIQYATTALFDIYGNDVHDTYQMTTELIDGYAPGHYAVLVEIYSLNHSYMVASEILDNYYLGREILLEDLARDEVLVYEEVTVSVSHGHGGGSFSIFFWLLLVQVVTAARVVLTLSPRRTIIRRRKDTSALRSFYLSGKSRD